MDGIPSPAASAYTNSEILSAPGLGSMVAEYGCHVFASFGKAGIDAQELIGCCQTQILGALPEMFLAQRLSTSGPLCQVKFVDSHALSTEADNWRAGSLPGAIPFTVSARRKFGA
jgi:hypothetical protein